MRKSFLKKAAVLGLAAVMALGGCASKPAAVVEESALKVNAVLPENRTLERKTAYTGRVMPDGAVFVIPKAQGEITRVNFNVGDKVNAGDVLFEVDSTISQIQLKQAESALAAAKAGLEQMTGATYEQQLVQLEGQITQAKNQRRWTDKNYDIFDDTFEASHDTMQAGIKRLEQGISGITAQIAALDSTAPDYDTVKSELEDQRLQLKAELSGLQSQRKTFLDSYESQYNQMNQGLEQIEISLDMAEKAYNMASGPAREEQIALVKAQLGQAEAGYQLAMENLSYSRVTAPINGVIQKKNVSVHGFATQSEPAFVIADNSALAITFGVSAEAASNMKVGDAVEVESGARTYAAAIAEISTMLDQTSGLFTIKALLQEHPPELMSGVAVKLTAVTARSVQTMTVPAAAVYYDDGKPYVYVISEGIAVKTYVKIGLVNEEYAEITEGIDTNAQIVTTWSTHLIDGAPVEMLEV